MRILYLCPDLGISLNGHKGASAHLRGFIRALKLLGHDVRAVVSSSDCDSWFDIPVTSIPESELLSHLPVENNPRLVRALKHVCNNIAVEDVMKKMIREFKPELIYERYSPFAAAGSIIARSMGIPHLLEVNALLAEEGKRFRGQALQEASDFLEETAFQSTSMIVAVSHVLRDSLIELGIPAAKIVVVPNGVDETFFLPVKTRKEEIFKDRTVIGFVGSLKPWHAIDLIADTFRALAVDPVYHLLVVGDGPMMNVLKGLEREFPGRVTLTGGISHQDVPEYISAMDIALAPYPDIDKFYFSPLKLFEYMALGRAIVATEIGQVKDIIRHGENGWLVPPGNTQEFIDVVRKLSGDGTLRQKLGTAAAEESRVSHSWRERAATILEFFRNKTGEGEMFSKAPIG